MSTTTLGRHLLADLSGIEPERLRDVALIEALLNESAHAAGATPIGSRMHHFGEGEGVTGVVLLRESHISIHTWPEFGFAAIDVFMCGSAAPNLAVDFIVARLKPEHTKLTDVTRGEQHAGIALAAGS